MMKVVRKIGLASMLLGVFTVAAHIYSHINHCSISDITNCEVCKSIAGAAVHSAVVCSPELVHASLAPEIIVGPVEYIQIVFLPARAPPIV